MTKWFLGLNKNTRATLMLLIWLIGGGIVTAVLDVISTLIGPGVMFFIGLVPLMIWLWLRIRTQMV